MKSDKIRVLPHILSLYRNKFNKFNNTGARISCDIKINIKSHFWGKRSYYFVIILAKYFIAFPKSKTHKTTNSYCLFLLFVPLCPKSTAMVMAEQSVYLTTLFSGQA